jgi:L-gulonate 5-dehydrogenase
LAKKVVLSGPGEIDVPDAEVPSLRPGYALVKLRLGGICGSDKAAYRGQSPLVRYPVVLGHELLVDVAAAPERQDLVGKRAVVEPLLNCGRCYACRAGRYNACTSLEVMGVHVDGGLRDETLVRLDRLYEVPDELPDNLAVLAEPASIAYRAVQRAEAEAGMNVVVFGAGPIGLLITQLLLRARGCRVMVVDQDGWRLGIAAGLGAVTIASDGHVADEVSQQTSGEMAHRVFEATGNPACTLETADVVSVGGRIVLVGWNDKPPTFNTVAFMRKEAELYASRNSLGAFPAVLRLMRGHAIDESVLLTHRFTLKEARTAFEVLDRGDRVMKIVIAP